MHPRTKAGPVRGSAFEALFHIGTQIQAKEIDLDSVLTTIVEQTARLVAADVCWLALLDDTHTTVAARVVHGNRSPLMATMAVPLGKGVGGVALQRHETVVVEDYDTFAQSTPASVRRAIHDEGIVSLIGAPLFREDRLIGVLYVGQRTRRPFDHDEPSLVSALAGQAAIAIENSRLLQQLDTKNRLLEHSAAIHDRLTSAALSEAGIDGIAGELADLLGRPIRLSQELIAPSSSRYGGDATDITSDEPPPVAVTIPIVAGEIELGTLAVEGAAPLTELHRRAVEQGAVVIAVELLRQQARQEVEWRLGGELLSALLATTGPVDARLAARAARYGLDLRQHHHVIVLEPVGEEPLDLTEVQNGTRRAMTAADHPRPGRTTALVAAIGVDQIAITIPASPPALADRVVAALQRPGSPTRDRFIAGISRPLTDLGAAHREAIACARFARIAGKPGTTLAAADLGAMRFLFALQDPAPIADYVDDQLSTLLAHENGRNGPLFSTLRAYLAAAGHHPTIAATCHIHTSTVKYRISRLETLLDRRLSDSQTRFELQLATAMLDFLWATGLRT